MLVEHEFPSDGEYTVTTTPIFGDNMSPTGFGSIPAADRQTRFMLEHGYSFEQAERNSVFDLTGSFDTVERMLREAITMAGPDYRVISWISPTPDAYKQGFAEVISRMSTDVPTGEIVWTEEQWDVARVERRDTRLLAGGHTVSVVAGTVNYTTGQTASHSRGLVSRSTEDGIDVLRCHVPAAYSRGYAGRMWAFFAFTVTSTLGVLRAPRPDVVVATSPPLTTGVTGWFASHRYHVPWVFEIRDLIISINMRGQMLMLDLD